MLAASLVALLDGMHAHTTRTFLQCVPLGIGILSVVLTLINALTDYGHADGVI